MSPAPQDGPDALTEVLQRTPEVQKAFDDLAARMGEFKALRKETARAQRALEKRLEGPRVVAEHLEAIARGDARAIRPAVNEGTAEYERQARELWQAADALVHARRKVLARAEAFRLAVRDSMAEMTNQGPLNRGAKGIAGRSQKQFADIQAWIEAMGKRWRPPADESAPGLDLEAVVDVLPDLDVAVAQPAAPSPEDALEVELIEESGDETFGLGA